MSTGNSGNSGISIMIWLSAIGVVFSTAWGFIMRGFNKKIDTVKKEAQSELHEKASKEQLDSYTRMTEAYSKEHGKSLKEMSNLITQKFISENKLTLTKLESLKYGQEENKQLVQETNRRVAELNEKMVEESLKTIEWRTNTEHELKTTKKDIEDIKNQIALR